MRCDFCSIDGPTWCYPAVSFVLESCSTAELGQASQGAWAACDDCRRLIEAGDLAGLAQRAVDSLIPENPEMLDSLKLLTVQMRELQAEFFKHRAGPAVPVGACGWM